MSTPEHAARVPTIDELEKLFVNNSDLERIEAYLRRFNPIKTMGMERMEIRHSYILAWLMDPQETHGLGDHFLKSFLSEAFRGRSDLGVPTALDLAQSDLRDAVVRREWKNIDIFVSSQREGWAFIIENKFDSKQGEGQLEKYRKSAKEALLAIDENPEIRGVFLTLNDEEPEDRRYATMKYEVVCEILDRVVTDTTVPLSRNVKIFITHYLNTLKDATGMNQELNELEKLARQLYMDHRRALDFIIEHGASTDFAIAVRTLFGDDADRFKEAKIGGADYVFVSLSKNYAWMLPKSWYEALGKQEFLWPGCENVPGGFPVFMWVELFGDSEGLGGRLRLYAEVGPLTQFELRRSLIEGIQGAANANQKLRIQFRRDAAKEGTKWSRFFRPNSIEVKDVTDSEEITTRLQQLLKKFQPEIDVVASVLSKVREFGTPIR